MRLSRPLFRVIAALATLTFSFADKVELTDGTVHHGKIITETEAEVRIEVQVSDSIRSVKSIRREDIKSVSRTPQSEIDLNKLKAVLPTPDFLTVAQYEERVAKANEFLREHAGTPQVKEARKLQKTLSEELARAKKGDLKVKGKWLTARTQQSDLVAIDAGKLRNVIEKNIASGRYVAALNQLDRLRSLYATTPSGLDAETVRKEVLVRYSRKLAAMNREFPRLVKARDNNLQRLPSEAKTRFKTQLENRQRAYEAAKEKAKEKKHFWGPVDKYDGKGIEKAMSQVKAALEGKSKGPKRNTGDLAADYRAAYGHIEAGRVAEAKKAMQSLARNKAAAKYRKILEKKIAAAAK